MLLVRSVSSVVCSELSTKAACKHVVHVTDCSALNTVFYALSPRVGKSSQIAVGLLEGIVPEDHPIQQLRGSAVFVEGPEIHR
jgi:hypothetical protein